MNFEPFDSEFEFNKEVLSEDFKDYQLISIKSWLRETLKSTKKLSSNNVSLSNELFVLPLNEIFRQTFSPNFELFWDSIVVNSKLFRNILSYVLQTSATEYQANKLERILGRTGSAYAVSTSKKSQKIAQGISVNKNVSKLLYRVSKVTSEQAAPILNTNALIQEAWDAFYGLKPNYEKVTTRCTDALAGILRDKFYPDDKKPQLGKLLGQLISSPEKFSIPGETIFDKEQFLRLMDNFTSIRGDHQTGTGRKPTKDEAKFVLHYTISAAHLLSLK